MRVPAPAQDDSPPKSETLTEYDQRHLITYLKLLDVAEAGANWRDVVRVIFKFDPGLGPLRANAIHGSTFRGRDG